MLLLHHDFRPFLLTAALLLLLGSPGSPRSGAPCAQSVRIAGGTARPAAGRRRAGLPRDLRRQGPSRADHADPRRPAEDLRRAAEEAPGDPLEGDQADRLHRAEGVGRGGMAVQGERQRREVLHRPHLSRPASTPTRSRSRTARRSRGPSRASSTSGPRRPRTPIASSCTSATRGSRAPTSSRWSTSARSSSATRRSKKEPGRRPGTRPRPAPKRSERPGRVAGVKGCRRGSGCDRTGS